MTPAQFARAVESLGFDEKSRHVTAAFQVLIFGTTQARAAKAQGIDRSAVLRAVKRIQSAAIACPCCGRAF